MYLYRAYFKRLIKKINAILYREIVNNRFISLFIHTNIFSSFVYKIKNDHQMHKTLHVILTVAKRERKHLNNNFLIPFCIIIITSKNRNKSFVHKKYNILCRIISCMLFKFKIRYFHTIIKTYKLNDIENFRY